MELVRVPIRGNNKCQQGKPTWDALTLIMQVILLEKMSLVCKGHHSYKRQNTQKKDPENYAEIFLKNL